MRAWQPWCPAWTRGLGWRSGAVPGPIRPVARLRPGYRSRVRERRGSSSGRIPSSGPPRSPASLPNRPISVHGSGFGNELAGGFGFRRALGTSLPIACGMGPSHGPAEVEAQITRPEGSATFAGRSRNAGCVDPPDCVGYEGLIRLFSDQTSSDCQKPCPNVRILITIVALVRTTANLERWVRATDAKITIGFRN